MNTAVAHHPAHMGTGSMVAAVATTPYAPFVAAGLPAPRGGGSLGRHVQQCARARGRWFGLRVACAKCNDALTPRFFTTIVLASGVICLLVAWV